MSFNLAQRPNFSKELMDYLVEELSERGYDVELSDNHIDIFLEDIKIGILYFHEPGEAFFESTDEGLYFVGGQLNYDFDSKPYKIDLINQDFVDRVIEHIESRRIYIDSERTNIKLPEGFPPIIRLVP